MTHLEDIAENVEFSAQQLRPGEYHIPIDSLNQANQTRQKLIMRYNEWLGNLSIAQRNYIDTNQLLRSANQQMFNQMNESPDELLRIILQRKGVNITSITSGETTPDIEKLLQKKGLDKEGNDYAELLKQKQTLYEKELNDITNLASPESRSVLLERQKNLEKDFFKIQSKNNSVKVVNKVANEILYENLRNTYEQILKELDKLITNSPRDELPPGFRPGQDFPLPPRTSKTSTCTS